ncbi:MAG: thioredoxin-like domain-containing protein [Dehalococcoidia bacterium]
MHILPQLRELERKHRDTLAVIGVHSAKFTTEKETENVREAVMRYGIEHPVINDRDFAVWQSYAVRAWPTLMFIDPTGRVIGRHEGEFPFDAMDRTVAEMIAEFAHQGVLDRRLLPYQLEAEKAEQRPLAFPGKIEADASTGRLFIADSNHHRVLVSDFEGHVTEVIGSGEAGSADGPFDAAVFDNPQGMAVDGDILYVADAGSHTIRKADLAARTVATIAGTGEQSLYRHTGGEPFANPLNSPYDLALHDDVLYIAMAGFHQLWFLDLAANLIQPFAGDGGEDIVDGPRDKARLAQPYGVAVSGDNVFFADSETSSVRAAKMGDGGRVVTLVGTGLFDFGDRDGVGKEAQLQHVQGIAVSGDTIYIADSYNHRIKSIDLNTLRVTTVAGHGTKGSSDGPAPGASFNEPAGLAMADSRIFVADTNNHAIRVLDLDHSTVATLELSGI